MARLDSPPGADADCFEASSHLLPVRHQKLTLSHRLTNLRANIIIHFSLCGQNLFAFKAHVSEKLKEEVTCLAFVLSPLTSFITPVFVPPDKTHAFVALAAPIRPALIYFCIRICCYSICERMLLHINFHIGYLDVPSWNTLNMGVLVWRITPVI